MDPQPVQPQEFPQEVSRSSSLPKILLGILGVIVILGFVGMFYYLGVQKNIQSTSHEETVIVSPTIAPTSTSSKVIPNPICNTPTGWKAYTSNTEKICFIYPTDWVIIKPTINYLASADYFSLQSPNGMVKVNWVSVISGLGGGCDAQVLLGNPNGCPLITVIDKTPIKNVSNLYVISGTVTRDGKVYQPWLAVQDDNGLVTTRRSVNYDLFMGRNNGSLSALRGINATAIFSTSGAYAGGPDLTQSEAIAWFDKPEVKQAKLILLSLTY